MSGAIHQWTARETRQAIRNKQTSATEVVQALLARIAQLDVRDDGRAAAGPALGAFLHVDRDRVLARAAALDADHATADQRPLFGVPVAVKDNLAVRGESTRVGSAATPDTPAAEDHVTVARLRAAGAVVVGLTNVPELCIFGTTEGVHGTAREGQFGQIGA